MKREAIPDFTDTELSVVRETVRERFRRDLEINPIEGEVRIDPVDRELTLCPDLYWRGEGKAQFVLFIPLPVLLPRASAVRHRPRGVRRYRRLRGHAAASAGRPRRQAGRRARLIRPPTAITSTLQLTPTFK